MLTKPDKKSVSDLLALKAQNMLNPNPEYQRGAVWSQSMKKRLADSVMRGYPIPLFYLHHIAKEVAGHRREDFDVIDGQQRINALFEYQQGAFPLFHPVNDAEVARFPAFILEEPCPWGGKRFEELDPDLQARFLNAELAVAMIQTDTPNEARDLFIRLQAGMPLNPQEKRDAWPGDFTDYCLRLGGKPEVARYPGHPFFTEVMGARPNQRGKYRQLAAQMVMLYMARRQTGSLCNVGREEIDAYYYAHLDFDAAAPAAKRFWEILTTLNLLLRDGKRKRIAGHEAIGLALLADALWDDYTPSWRDSLAAAFDDFRGEVAKATRARLTNPGSEYWARYGQWARTGTDKAENIERRHAFFASKMRRALRLQLKDPQRAFGELEREIIYHRDHKQCQVPGHGEQVLWPDAEVHHVRPHAEGGTTKLANGALVNRQCHPRSKEAVEEFERAWLGKARTAGATG